MKRTANIHPFGKTVVVDTDTWEETDFNIFWERLGRIMASGVVCRRRRYYANDTHEFYVLKITGSFHIHNYGDRIFLVFGIDDTKTYLTFRSKCHEYLIANGMLTAGVPAVVTQAINLEYTPYPPQDLESEIMDFIEDYLE